MRVWCPVLLLTAALAAGGCGGSSDPPPAGSTGATVRTATGEDAPKDVAGSPASRVRGWPNAFCRVRVGGSRASATGRMGPPTSTSVGPRGRQDEWVHLEVGLIAAYDRAGRIRKLKDGTGDSRLPCSARRTGDASLDAYAGRYQRACRTIVSAQRRFSTRLTQADAATGRRRAARLRREAQAQALVSFGRAGSLMRGATPPAALRSTQRRVAPRLPSTPGVQADVSALRAGGDTAGAFGTSFRFLRLPERLLVVAPNCDDVT